MIKITTQILPNETFYSWIARLAMRSGFGFRGTFIKEVYKNEKTFPSLFFIGKLNDDFFNEVSKYFNIKELLEEHTLFKYFVNFVGHKRKQTLLDMALNNFHNLYNFLPKLTNTSDCCLKYCPLCVEEDRNTYGEAYFHVNHQVPKSHICTKHNCELINTEVHITNYRIPKVIPLELLINNMEVIKVDDKDIRFKISHYIDEVLKEEFKINSKEKMIGEILTSYVDNKYIRITNRHRYNDRFIEDLNRFYKGIKVFNLNGLNSLLHNHNWNPYEICLLGLFEKIKPKDLVNRKVKLTKNNRRTSWNEIDKELTKKFIAYTTTLKEIEIKDLNLMKVGNLYNIPSYQIRRRLPLLYQEFYKVKDKVRNWIKFDDECCLELMKVIESNSEIFEGQIITKKFIAELLGIENPSLRELPKLRKMVVELEIKYNGRAFYHKNLGEISAKINEDT